MVKFLSSFFLSWAVLVTAIPAQELIFDAPATEQEAMAGISNFAAIKGALYLSLNYTAPENFRLVLMADGIISYTYPLVETCHNNPDFQARYEETFIKLAKLINSNKQKLIKAGIRFDRSSTGLAMKALKSMLPDEYKKLIPGEELDLSEPEEALSQPEMLVANYFCYVEGNSFIKLVDLLETMLANKVDRNEINRQVIDIVKDDWRIAAQYQLVLDPTLKTFADHETNAMFIECMTRTWNSIPEDVKKDILSDPLLKTWIEKWQELL